MASQRIISRLGDALCLMDSSTISERQKGIGLFSDLLANRSNLEPIKESHWTRIFQQLFLTCETEKSAFLKQSTSRKGPVSTPGSLSRLQAVIALIRKCVASFVSLFKHKVMKMVVNRTLALIVTSGRTLMDVITLDCIRILKDFFSYKPHLEHLNPKVSSELLAICFASILDRKMPKSFMLLDNAEFCGAEPSSSQPQPTAGFAAASPKIIDSAQLLSMVISHSSSVCLECSKSLLYDFQQVLNRFPRENSAHFHLLTALHRLLRELELNKGADLSQSSLALGESLTTLWPTKNSLLKEQIILSLTYILPFIIREAQICRTESTTHVSMEPGYLLKRVLGVILNDAELDPKISTISLSTVRLMVPPRGSQRSLLSTAAFSYANGDGANLAAERVQITNWLALRLGAHALNSVVHSAHRPSLWQSPVVNKRRKVEDELEIFLQGIKIGCSPACIVHRLQLLTIAIDLYWNGFDNQIQTKIIRSVHNLLQSNDSTVLNWVFVLFGNLAHCTTSLSTDHSDSAKSSTTSASELANPIKWDEIWLLAIHQTSNPICGRAASYAAFCILSTHQIPSHITQHGVYNFLRDLYIRGPPFPYESVCMLVSECLGLALENSTLATFALHEKALLWLTKIWSEVDHLLDVASFLGGYVQRNRRIIPAGFDSEAILHLFFSLSKQCPILLSPPIVVLPDCATTDALLYLGATQTVRSSIFPDLKGSNYKFKIKSSRTPRQFAPRNWPCWSTAKHDIYAMLQKSLKKIFEEIEDRNANIEQLISNLTCAHVQLMNKILIVVLFIQASSSDLSASLNQENTRVIVSFFNITLQLLESQKWLAFERALIFACFEPIILPAIDSNQVPSYDTLATPKEASGVSLKQRLKLNLAKSPIDRCSIKPKILSPVPQWMLSIWSLNSAMRSQFDAFSEMCKATLHSFSSWTSSDLEKSEVQLTKTQSVGTTINFDEEEDTLADVSNQSHETESFSNIESLKHKGFRTELGGNEKATTIVASVCIRALVTRARTSDDPNQHFNAPSIASMISKCSGSEIIILGTPVVNCISGGLMAWATDHIDQILQKLGETYLTSYTYSQNISINKMTLLIIQNTLQHWRKLADGSKEPVETTARELCGYMIKHLLQGNLRSWEVQNELCIFLHAYLKHDPLQTNWEPHTFLEDFGAHEEVSCQPANLILQFLQDQDYRVRHSATLLVPHYFELAYSKNFDSEAYWQQVCKHLCSSSTELEVLLTCSLCIINIFIISEEVRPHAYYKVLRILLQPKQLPDQIIHEKLAQNNLKHASFKLGFASISELYRFYAVHIAVEQHQQQHPPIHPNHSCIEPVPEDNLNTELLQAHLLAASPFPYMDDKPNTFEECVSLTGLKNDEALQLCLPVVTAKLLAWACTAVDMDTKIPAINHLIRKPIQQMTADSGLECDIIQIASDQVVFHLMHLIQIDTNDIDNIPKIVLQDSGQQNVFEVLTFELKRFTLCQPTLPFYPILRIAQAIAWLGEHYPVAREPAVIYNIICRSFTSLANCHFTNHRLRLLYALSIYISFSHIPISNSLPILSLLLQALTPLLSNDDTFRPICAFGRWTVAKILQPFKNSLKDHVSIARLIISTAEQLKHVANSTSSKTIDICSAKEFNSWILDHISKTGKMGTPEYQKLCQHLMLHWPERHHIPIDEHAIKTVLSCPSGPSFQLIHHLNGYRFQGNKDQIGQILYHLLSSAQDMKSEIEVEDCQAYLELLYQNFGTLTVPRLGQLTNFDSQSNLEEQSLNSEEEIVSQIFAIVISLLQTSDFQLVKSLTEFLQRASACEILPNFDDKKDLIAPLLVERAVLTCHKSNAQVYCRKSISKPTHPLGFASLEKLAHSCCDWTFGFLQLLIASRPGSSPFYNHLIPLIQNHRNLAAKFLPQVLHSCLLNELNSSKNNLRADVSNHISTIFRSSTTDQNVIIQILELVTNLRHHQIPGNHQLGNDLWLHVSWIELANQAICQGLPAFAFLFVELAREHGCAIDFLQPLKQDVQSLLENLYRLSPEPDAFYSLMPSDPTKFLIQKFKHEHQWGSALEFHGAILEGHKTNSQAFCDGLPSLASYLSSSGLNQLAHTIFQTHTRHDQDFNSTYSGEIGQSSTLTFELAWRASTWDLPVSNQFNLDSSTRVYATLKSCHEEQEKNVQFNISKDCLLGQFKELIKSTSAHSQPSYQIIGTALALSDVVSWLGGQECDPDSLVRLPSECPYNIFEQISAIRQSLLQAVKKKKTLNSMQDDIINAAHQAELKLRIKTSQAARQSGNLQTAVSIITPFAELANQELSDVASKVKEEFAEVLWAKGEQGLALNIMKAVQATQKALPESALQLCRIGEWLSLARLNSSEEIMNYYFQNAIKSLSHHEHPEEFGKISYAYAKFADEQYHKLLRLGEAKKLLESIQQLKRDIHTIDSFPISDEETCQMIKSKQLQLKVESHQLQSLSDLQGQYLSSALEMYLSSLAYCDQHDDVIFRYVSVWLGHHSNEKLNQILQSPINSVPTHKFICVSHLLLARLNIESHSEFQEILTRLITNLGKDHPFHIIYQVLLLQRGIESACLSSQSDSRSRRTSNVSTPSNKLSSTDLSRALAVDTILSALYKTQSKNQVIKQIITVHRAFKEWALYSLPSDLKKKPKMTQIPAKMLLNNLKDLSVPIPTVFLPIDKTCQYHPESMPCISYYDTKFKPASGVHAPKITSCRGSDGKIYTQLFKGGDDVRQDAIMEQVFELVNNVLTRDPECQKRRLNFKTYNVIPLSPDAGVIEFVTNTSPLFNILYPVHQRYNEPQDWNFQKMRAHLNTENTKERIERYKEVVQNCRPAMRFWFFEVQKNPQKWYEMRLNFTRSVATTSMVGHLLGLGDRHLSNILVDKLTGEVVQIDLGIAFEMGKTLPVPETVPFRLTRDIVDGFGVAKTEGVFRRCCEKTLRVLRENKSLIMTIIDVLKYDPLQPWIIKEQKEKRFKGLKEDLDTKKQNSKTADKGDESLTQVSEQASRALETIEKKLSSDLSVETTVNQLILDATSVKNLGSLFYGWSAFY